ncbi:unnamed protein product [Prunus armeniaca]
MDDSGLSYGYSNNLFSPVCSLANVDPIDVARSIARLNPETTLIVVVSKTFTTAETMLNARTLREWISSSFGLVQCQHFFKYMNRLFQFRICLIIFGLI